MKADSVRTIFYALGANLAIAVAKTGAAIFTGSSAMLAEAIHSYADSGNQLLLLWGMRQARRPPSPDYPLGWGKAVFFWSFIVALVLFVLGGLFSVYEGLLSGFPRTPLARLAASDKTWMAGTLASVRSQMTRRGRMMVVVLDDGTAQVEVTVFNELFEKHRDKLKEDALLIVAGKVQRDDFSGGLRVLAEDLLDLETLRGRYGARLKISMNGGADAKRLQQVLAPYRATGTGACLVIVSYGNGKGACEVVLGESWRVRPDNKLISDLGAWLTPENVELVIGA